MGQRTAPLRCTGADARAGRAQPERFRWTDAGGSHVTCEFRNDHLAEWQLVRPPKAPQAGDGHGAMPGSARHTDGAPAPGGICQPGTRPP